MKRDKGHHITVKGTIGHENMTLANIYAPNTGEPRYVKEILMDIKRETDSNSVTVGDFTIQLT